MITLVSAFVNSHYPPTLQKFVKRCFVLFYVPYSFFIIIIVLALCFIIQEEDGA